MSLANAHPIINACLRLVQTYQSAAITAVLAGQTETQPTGFSAVATLSPLVAWEKDVHTQVSLTPILTVVAQTRAGDGILNEGRRVVHTVQAEIYFYDQAREAKLAESYLYGEVLYQIFFELTGLADFSTGLSRYKVESRQFRSLEYGSGKLANKIGFAGGATITFDLSVIST